MYAGPVSREKRYQLQDEQANRQIAALLEGLRVPADIRRFHDEMLTTVLKTFEDRTPVADLKIATAKIEELMLELKNSYTIVIVTHNMQQAARVSDYTGFMLLGELVEFGVTRELFTNPKNKKTEDYITGRFG